MQDIETKYIFSAGLHVSGKPMVMNTVLGSCVSVCLWDQAKKIGGMNHFMLPFWNGNGLASPKYGNIAMQQLIGRMIELHCSHDDLVAKVFGGARMLREHSAYFDIGRRNTGLAIRTLEAQYIPVIAQSTGGEKGRRIVFNTETGEVLQKYL